MSNSALTTIGAFNQVSTMSSITLSNNPELASLSAFAELTTLNALGMYNASKIATLSLPKLEAVAYVGVGHTAGLVTIEMPALVTIDTMLQLYGNASLTTMSAPQLTSVGRLYVYDNDALTSLDLSSLTAITTDYGAEILGNASYRTCLAEALRDQLASNAGGFSIIAILAARSCALAELRTVASRRRRGMG